MNLLAAKILAVLPQTQCTRCGYPDCTGYAQALAQGQAAINQCPPGGVQGIEQLACLTGQPVLPLNPVHGTEGPRSIVFIDEDGCIGCTLCIKACPTDAIMGSNKLMHTVIEAYCTGCELCLPVCPVDCIELENVSASATGWDAWSQSAADQARSRYAFNRSRVPGPAHLPGDTSPAIADKKHALIEAALGRARARREPGRAPD
jgi:electron transport complex protein RnfB